MSPTKKVSTAQAPATARSAPTAPAKSAPKATKAEPGTKAAPAKVTEAKVTEAKAPMAKAPAKAAPAAKATGTKATVTKAAVTKVAPAKATVTRSAPAKAAPAKAPPAKAPPVKAKVAGPYAGDTKFLDEQRQLLIEERAVYLEQAHDLKAEADSLAQEREPGDVQFDEESGEGGTVTVDRERDLALSAQALLAVEEIDDAMVRIENRTYGACERCHQPIPKPRLRALPYARLCVACKSGGLSRR